MLEVGAGFLAPDAPGTVEHDVLVLAVGEQILDFADLVAEGLGGGQDRATEVADLAFVVVSHVDHHGVGLLGEGVEFLGGYVLSAVGHIEPVIVQSVGDNLVPDLDDELEETLVVAFDGDVEPDALEPVDGLQAVPEVVETLGRDAQLGVDPLSAHVNPAQHSEGLPGGEEVVAEEVRVVHFGVTVQAQCGALALVPVESVDQGSPVKSVVQRRVHDGKNSTYACAGEFRYTFPMGFTFAVCLLIGYFHEATPYANVIHHSMKMLEYCQRILAKVSFDRHLFAKELAKSIKRLETADISRLRQWCMEHFGQRYQDIILNTFPAQIAM